MELGVSPIHEEGLEELMKKIMLRGFFSTPRIIEKPMVRQMLFLLEWELRSCLMVARILVA